MVRALMNAGADVNAKNNVCDGSMHVLGTVYQNELFIYQLLDQLLYIC